MQGLWHLNYTLKYIYVNFSDATFLVNNRYVFLLYLYTTGDTLTISRVSPEAIILRPPEKLVIEVDATGRYELISWTRNGNLFSEMMTSQLFVRFPFVFPTSSELVNYFEIFVREPTTESDFGVYEVQLHLLDPNNQIIMNGGQVDFAVIQAGELLVVAL